MNDSYSKYMNIYIERKREREKVRARTKRQGR